MSDSAELFSNAHRHSFGVCLSQLGEHVRSLRAFGADVSTLEQLEQELRAFADETGATPPQQPRNLLNATLVQMLVLEEELRPRRMAAYGSLSAEAACVLDAHVQRLVDLTETLIAQTEQRS